MDEIEVKVTWHFAWALFWRMLLMYMGIAFVVWLIIAIVVMVIDRTFCPYL